MKSRTAALLIAATCLAAGASAAPSFTTINNTSGEVSQAQLLHAIYGGTWTAIGGSLNFTNGTLTATRAADGGMSTGLDVFSGDPALGQDDIWSGGLTTITARAKYAADTHAFGWINSGSAPSSGFQSLLSTTSFNSPVTVTLSGSFRWALNDLTTGQMSSSLPSENIGGIDQMATYRMSGAAITQPTWLLVWEDRFSGADRDFNDSAIELVAVPTPGTTALGAMGMGLIAARRRRAAV